MEEKQTEGVVKAASKLGNKKWWAIGGGVLGLVALGVAALFMIPKGSETVEEIPGRVDDECTDTEWRPSDDSQTEVGE